ncbi:NYN domain-containing protein [Actinacidiphila glaucinigra]|uniref:NYN domain-containing protein n=1 Tax=Actinacidiphila glaucinigra TaxID=235986 RepID=UPI002E2F68FC|nr:hypothetical protein [Actinacidiphila glaucinigra]
MSRPTVILDASNLARARGNRWLFSRVCDVRAQWLREHPAAFPYAVLDASVRPYFEDKRLIRQAEGDHWLEVHPGDADDEILRLAEQYGAAVVSHDNYRAFRRDYPWLQDCEDRLWSVRRKGDEVTLHRRRLKAASDAQIDEDLRNKARKAGLLASPTDRRWHCAAPTASDCHRSGEELEWNQVHELAGRWYCRSCDYPAEEILTRAAPVDSLPGPPTVTLMHGFRTVWTQVVPDDGMLVGRPSRKYPDSVDVTAGLPADQADEVSRGHLRLFLDDDGELLAEHRAANNASFINPQLGKDGRPLNQRMVRLVHFPLDEGDEVFLGPGVVRLVVGRDDTVGSDRPDLPTG